MWKKFRKEEFNVFYKTVLSEQAAVNELVSLSKGDEAAPKRMIHLSIANGWKRFFELKCDNNGNSKSFVQSGSDKESYSQHSQRLIQCLIKMDMQETKLEAKVEFIGLVSDFMPSGTTAFLSIVKYPMIKFD